MERFVFGGRRSPRPRVSALYPDLAPRPPLPNRGAGPSGRDRRRTTDDLRLALARLGCRLSPTYDDRGTDRSRRLGPRAGRGELLGSGLALRPRGRRAGPGPGGAATLRAGAPTPPARWSCEAEVTPRGGRGRGGRDAGARARRGTLPSLPSRSPPSGTASSALDAGGRPLSPVYSLGRHPRGGGGAPAATTRWTRARSTGARAASSTPAIRCVKLAWLRRRDPAAFARVAAWVLVRRVPGGAALRPEALLRSRIASGTGLLDVHRLRGIRRRWRSPASAAAASRRSGGLGRAAARAPAGVRRAAGPSWRGCLVPRAGRRGLREPGERRGGAGLRRGDGRHQRRRPRPLASGGRGGGPARASGATAWTRRWWMAGGALSNGGNAVALPSRAARASPGAAVGGRGGGDGAGLARPHHAALPGGGARPRVAARDALGGHGARGRATAPEQLLRAWMEAVAYRLGGVCAHGWRRCSAGGPR